MKRQEELKSGKLPEYKDLEKLKSEIAKEIMLHEKNIEILKNLRFEFNKTQENLKDENLDEAKREETESKILDLIYKIGDKEKTSENLKETILKNIVSYIKVKRKMYKEGLIKVNSNDPDYYIYNENKDIYKAAVNLYKNLSCYIKAQGY